MSDQEPRWTCPRCGTRNRVEQDECRTCLRSRREMRLERRARSAAVLAGLAVVALFLVLKVL